MLPELNSYMVKVRGSAFISHCLDLPTWERAGCLPDVSTSAFLNLIAYFGDFLLSRHSFVVARVPSCEVGGVAVQCVYRSSTPAHTNWQFGVWEHL